MRYHSNLQEKNVGNATLNVFIGIRKQTYPSMKVSALAPNKS